MADRRRLLVLVSLEGEAQKRELFERCDALRERYDLHVLCGPDDREAFSALGVPVESWRPQGFIGMARAISRLRKTTERIDPDVILTSGWPPASVALGTFPTRFASRTIAYFTDPLRYRELPRRQIERRFPAFLARAGAVACASPSLASAMEERFGMAKGTIAIVPFGIVPPLENEERARPPARPGPILGWYGTLGADRAWQTAIDAFAQVREELPDATLVVAGDGKARQFVAAHARMRKVDDAVTFDRKASPGELFAKIDLLLVPQSRDALPHVLLEALAYGVPIVAANDGALADALEPFETGWLVDDDPEGLCDGVLAAWPAIDDAWRGAMAQRAAAIERYDRAVVDARMSALFARVEASART